MMTSTTWVIDADAHVTEAPDVWTSRVPTQYRDQVPRVVRDKDGRDIWVIGDTKISTVGANAPAGWKDAPQSAPPTYDDILPAAYDPKARIEYLNEVGIWAQVLYPNVGGFGSQKFLTLGDAELQFMCVRAYNDFMHEWASVAPDRLIPVLSIPFWSVEEAVKEIKRGAEMGFRAVLFTGEPMRFGLPTLGDRSWDPLWDVTQEAEIPIHFHLGGGEDTLNFIGEQRLAVHGLAASHSYEIVNLLSKNGVQCADLITSGVLERFPGLKFVSVESGIGWIPFVLESADFMYLGAFEKGRVRRGDYMLPSELFRRQVYATYWFESVPMKHLLDEIPVDRILFETDFPHEACLYGDISDRIDAQMGHLAEEPRHRILWENASALYGVKEPDVEIAVTAG
jgi:predicted TIM-barrel fold metal-dependent hydrolase